VHGENPRSKAGLAAAPLGIPSFFFWVLQIVFFFLDTTFGVFYKSLP
jgi:hypothetical protein